MRRGGLERDGNLVTLERQCSPVDLAHNAS